MPPQPGICVVIPTYNEKENMEPVIESLESTRVPGLSVIFVDDSSPDGTGTLIRSMMSSRPWVRLVERERKLGLGSAYQDGFRAALDDPSSGILVEMDADLQHPASAIPLLVDAIRKGADVAIGSRYVPGGGISGWSRLRRLTSRGANAYSRFMLGLETKDATSGLRAYTREVAATIAESKLPAKGFEFQVSVLHLLKKRAKIVEVPYVFSSRRAGESKLKLGDMARFFYAVARAALFERPVE